MEAAHPRDVPAYLPDLTWPLLPWARRHVRSVARRYHIGRDDLWDETVTALLRASLYFKPQDPADYRAGQYAEPLPPAKSFRYYAQLAVHRACWRYVCRHAAKQPLLVVIADDVDLDLELSWPSSEAEALAREAITLRLAAVTPDVIPVQLDSAGTRGRTRARS